RKGPRSAPAAHLDVVVLVPTLRHRGMGWVRQLDEERVDPVVDLLHLVVEDLDALADLSHLRPFRGGVFAPLAGLADGLRSAIAEGLEILGFLDEAPARGVVGDDILDVLGAALAGERALDRLGLLTNLPELQHGPRWRRRARRSPPRRGQQSRRDRP